jgi:hypothetical protein
MANYYSFPDLKNCKCFDVDGNEVVNEHLLQNLYALFLESHMAAYIRRKDNPSWSGVWSSSLSRNPDTDRIEGTYRQIVREGPDSEESSSFLRYYRENE